jgi:hypothetical protein
LKLKTFHYKVLTPYLLVDSQALEDAKRIRDGQLTEASHHSKKPQPATALIWKTLLMVQKHVRPLHAPD